MYGLPKIHKQGTPLRSIVSTINSPTYKLAKYLANYLKDFTGHTSSHILNSGHFIQRISDLRLDPQDLLVSFDVTSLFTKVPTRNSLIIIEQILKDKDKDVGLVSLINKCLTSTAAVLEFQDHLNTQHPDIKFTMEVEANGSLPFLDVLVTRHPNGSIGWSLSLS